MNKEVGATLAQSAHVPVLDHLRGLAALSVAVYHFTNGNTQFLADNDILKQIGSFGWLGVEAFFVISGFVIPYSLYLKAYKIGDFFNFMTRRLKRLEPPYLACIALILILDFLSSITPGFRGEPFNISWAGLIAHIAYMNAVFDYGWLNPVFWTLAIEFQFYIFVALVFGFISGTRLEYRIAAILLIAISGFLGAGNKALLLHWLPLFALGMVTFQLYIGLISKLQFILVLSLVVVLCHEIVGPMESGVGLFTCLAIALIRNRQLPKLFDPLIFLGLISYSLYLIHVPVGGRIINLGSRLPESTVYRYPVIIFALGVSILTAWFFWKFIEQTSQRWAKSTAAPRETEGVPATADSAG